MHKGDSGVARAGGGVVFAVVVGVCSAAARGAAYDLMDLGTALGPGAVATSINDVGAIAGRYVSPTGVHPFIYQNGTRTDLGVPPGTWDSVGAEGISSNGIAAGEAFAPDSSSAAAGVNASGAAVGWYLTSTGGMFPVLWNNGVPTTLTPPNSTGGIPHAINNAGTVVGRYKPRTSADQKAFVYQDGTYTVLPTLTGQGGTAHALNDVGGVAGTSTGSTGELHAVYYANGQIVDIGTLGGRLSDARGVNNSGVVVGAYEPAGVQGLHGFVYRDGQAIDLNDLIDPAEGFVVESARGINNSGQIVGTGHRAGDTTPYSYLLTPVPEPAGALAATAALALASLRRRSPNPLVPLLGG